MMIINIDEVNKDRVINKYKLILTFIGLIKLWKYSAFKSW